MQCPKCGGRIVVDIGGYARANVALGLGTPLPNNLSCQICGFYKEVFGEPEEVQVSMKNKNNYPDVRRSLGDSGWLRGIVESEFNRISRMRARGLRWNDVVQKLSKQYPALAASGHNSVGNVWNRLEREKHDSDNQ